MSVQSYPVYQDSGVPWLGAVPAGWQILPFKRVYKERTERSRTGEESLLSVSAYTGVSPRSELIDLGDDLTRAATLVGYKNVYSKDLVVNIMLAWNRGLGVSQHQGIVSPAYCVFEPSHSLYHKYIDYTLRSDEYIQYFKAYSTGVIDSRLRIYPDVFLSLKCVLPPINEQLAITAFLDRETVKIDALLAEQERLIALLKEKRQAVISQAVTKGLDPTVPMKDSGLEWLGEVPAHWDIVKFGKGIIFQEGPGIMASDFLDEGVPLIRVAGVQQRWASLQGCNFLDPIKVASRWTHFKVKKGDIIISGSASTGTVCEVGSDVEGAIPYTGLITLRPKNDLTTREFIRSVVVSDMFIIQIDLVKTGATIQHFGPTHLAQMRIVLPPLEEQFNIAEYIENKNQYLMCLMKEAEQAITLLRERRSALISAVVTGKIDVRGLVPTVQEAA